MRLDPARVDAVSGLGADAALEVTVPIELAEAVGAVLMEHLGPFEIEHWLGGLPAPVTESFESSSLATLVFYPEAGGYGSVTASEALSLLPWPLRRLPEVVIRDVQVSREWRDAWKDHLRPVVVGGVRLRPPWEPPLGSGRCPDSCLLDVEINPGLGFGTGLHPTTRRMLELLQVEPSQGERPTTLGPLVDVGTGSGVLAVVARLLGYQPVLAFDNDPLAVTSALENVARNKVDVQVVEGDLRSCPLGWFRDATVLANLTLPPLSDLLQRLGDLRGGPSGVCAGRVAGRLDVRRLLVSGLWGEKQEEAGVQAAAAVGLEVTARREEEGWVTLELLPKAPRLASAAWTGTTSVECAFFDEPGASGEPIIPAGSAAPASLD